MVCSVWQAWGRVAGGRCMNRYATLASPPCHRDTGRPDLLRDTPPPTLFYPNAIFVETREMIELFWCKLQHGQPINLP